MSTQKKKHIILLMATILLISTACVISNPFAASAPAPEPVEEIDPDTLETMIAVAVVEKVAQTLEALPPTKIATAIPTETQTPTATAIPTKIPPTPTSAYPKTGSDLQENDDGSFMFSDYKAAYSLKLPTAEWLSLRPDSAEYRQAWVSPEASNPVIQQLLKEMEKFDPEIQRLIILDLQKEHYENGFLTYFNVALDHENNKSLEESFAQFVLERPSYQEGLVVTAADISKTSLDIPVGLVVSEWDITGSEGEVFHIYRKTAIFLVKDRCMYIHFTTTSDLKDEMLPIFDELINSFEFLQ